MLNFAIGFVTGFGTGFFTRELANVPRQGLRPTLKAIIRPIYQASLKTRESIAMAGETFEDIVAEMRAEAAAERAKAPKGEEPTETTAVVVEHAGEPTAERAQSAGGR
jgi:hypothetical protein